MTILHQGVPGIRRQGNGERGKSAEAAVRGWLVEFDERHFHFDFYRYPDARSAGGRAQTAPADFGVYYEGRNLLLEVKEVAHDFLLPAKNMKLHQIARARKRIAAGGEAYVLVKHTTSSLWRLIPTYFFFDKLSQPSWNLQEFETYGHHRPALDALVLGRLRTSFSGYARLSAYAGSGGNPAE